MFLMSIGLMSQNITIKKTNDKEFIIINKSSKPTNVTSELWLNGNYLGKIEFHVANDTLKCNVDNWKFVQEENLNVFISNIKIHKYEAKEVLPNSKEEDFFLTFKMTDKEYSEWRIYLRGG